MNISTDCTGIFGVHGPMVKHSPLDTPCIITHRSYGGVGYTSVAYLLHEQTDANVELERAFRVKKLVEAARDLNDFYRYGGGWFDALRRALAKFETK